jgi:hypothetical protein
MLPLVAAMVRVIPNMRPRRMQFTIRQTIIGVALLSILMSWGLAHARRLRLRFDFYDYRMAADEPLVNPTAFLGLEGDRVRLAGGRILEVEATTWRDSNYPAVPWSPGDLKRLVTGLEDELARMRIDGAPGVVDLEAAPDGRTLVYVRKSSWTCGTCLGPPPIHIPLFRRTVYLNRRLLIGIGRLKLDTQPSPDCDDGLPIPVVSPPL